MKIIVAVDSFKECLSSKEIADIIEEGIISGARSKEEIEIKKLIVADGGEGTVEALVDATQGQVIYTVTKGPLMQDVNSRYGVLGDGRTVVIDMSSTCSIAMLSEEEKNPMNTTTFGMGEQILDAIDKGYRRFIIGVGGSCTNDGGVGMLQSLGYRFIGKDGQVLSLGEGGKQLSQIESVDCSFADKRLKDCEFIIASDVKNPLYGQDGAAYIYAPQKGATPEMVKELDIGLQNYAKVVQQTFDIDISRIHGSGAAGGLAGGIIAFLNGKIKSGIETIMLYNNFEKELENTDLVITGEGKIDVQTLNGKAPYIISQKAKQKGISVIGICGKNETNEEIAKNIGMDLIYEISNNNLPLSYNLLMTRENLKNVAENIGRKI